MGRRPPNVVGMCGKFCFPFTQPTTLFFGPSRTPPPLPWRGKADFPLEERLGSEREGRKREKIKTRARKVQKQQFELTALSLSLSLNPCLFTKCRQSVSCGVKLGREPTNGATAETRAPCHATRGRGGERSRRGRRSDRTKVKITELVSGKGEKLGHATLPLINYYAT